ncbi:MAG TPA: hypothetical protein DDW49_09360 [Deltaproteobacteria bacterium]|nr:MAG: hypothetical protein A2048_01805 [Deltaproteobacteria bacterium GWA2_45_12]HBF13569.1 hypothetical protein [Deltaproteobacteria bacterium]
MTSLEYTVEGDIASSQDPKKSVKDQVEFTPVDLAGGECKVTDPTSCIDTFMLDRAIVDNKPIYKDVDGDQTPDAVLRGIKIKDVKNPDGSQNIIYEGTLVAATPEDIARYKADKAAKEAAPAEEGSAGDTRKATDFAAIVPPKSAGDSNFENQKHERIVARNPDGTQMVETDGSPKYIDGPTLKPEREFKASGDKQKAVESLAAQKATEAGLNVPLYVRDMSAKTKDNPDTALQELNDFDPRKDRKGLEKYSDNKAYARHQTFGDAKPSEADSDRFETAWELRTKGMDEEAKFQLVKREKPLGDISQYFASEQIPEALKTRKDEVKGAINHGIASRDEAIGRAEAALKRSQTIEDGSPGESHAKAIRVQADRELLERAKKDKADYLLAVREGMTSDDADNRKKFEKLTGIQLTQAEHNGIKKTAEANRTDEEKKSALAAAAEGASSLSTILGTGTSGTQLFKSVRELLGFKDYSDDAAKAAIQFNATLQQQVAQSIEQGANRAFQALQQGMQHLMQMGDQLVSASREDRRARRKDFDKGALDATKGMFVSKNDKNERGEDPRQRAQREQAESDQQKQQIAQHEAQQSRPPSITGSQERTVG